MHGLEPGVVGRTIGQPVVCVLRFSAHPPRRLTPTTRIPPHARSGKKYKKLKLRKSTEDWAEKYEPFLVPSVNFPNMMFCALTNHVIKKNQAVVEEHLKGRKFKTAQGRCLCLSLLVVIRETG